MYMEYSLQIFQFNIYVEYFCGIFCGIFLPNISAEYLDMSNF